MKALLFISLVFISLNVSAQRVANTFQAVENGDFPMQKLDAIYPTAISSDTKTAVFKGPLQDKFIIAYTNMLNTLAGYLNKNNFVWGTPTRIFNRVYFAPDGSINYYLVNLIGSGLDDTRQKRFLVLLNSFIATHKINITADTRFAQCSPVIYKDQK